MRSKATLLLIEQLVMLAVFALAAALCMQAFVKSDVLSRRTEARDHAVLAAQSAAETLRWIGGDAETALSGAAERLGGGCDGGVLRIGYGEGWEPLDAAEGAASYWLEAQTVQTAVPGLCRAQVTVFDADGEPLFALETAWQEDDANA